MRRTLVGLFIFAGIGLQGFWPQRGMADPIAQLPEFIVKDQNGNVLGILSQQSFPSGVIVLLRDTTHNENYFIQISTTLMRGSDSPNVYFTNTNCTGTAYVDAPSAVNASNSSIASLRGSVFVVGPDGLGGTVANRVYRGAGVGANNNGVINSRFQASLTGAASCDAGIDPSGNSVQATIVKNLSSFVTPFVIE